MNGLSAIGTGAALDEWKVAELRPLWASSLLRTWEHLKEPIKEGRVIKSPNIALVPDCPEVNGRCVQKHANVSMIKKCLQKMKEHTSETRLPAALINLCIPWLSLGKSPISSVWSAILGRTKLSYHQPCQSYRGMSVINLWTVFIHFLKTFLGFSVFLCTSHRLKYSWHHSLTPKQESVT